MAGFFFCQEIERSRIRAETAFYIGDEKSIKFLCKRNKNKWSIAGLSVIIKENVPEVDTMREENKKRRKQMISAVLAVTMGMSVLTGCGGSTSKGGEQGTVDVVKELKGEYQASPFVQADINSDTVEWICAAYAVYTQYNQKMLGVVGGIAEEHKESYQDRIKLTLSEGWGIEGREDVAEVINKLLTKGHRETYLDVVKKLEKKDLLKLSTEEAMTHFSEDDKEFARYQDAHEMYTEYGEHGMDGWDYSRALQVLGDCYLADYINLEECLDLSLPIAKTLQSTFTSWEELADSYIYGYAFWQNETADDVETKLRIQSYVELVKMENSPYSVAYDTKLENTWKDGEKRKEERKAYEMSDGYVPIRCTDTESVQVRLPEEYEFQKEDYEEYENTKFTKSCGDGDSIYISYQAEFLDDRNNAELQKKYLIEGNAKEKENAEKQGATYEAGEIKSLSVKEDLTVFYLAEKEVTEGGTQQISYQAVAEVGGKYLVKCYISDVASPGYELMLGMNEEALVKELFSDFRW